MVRVRTVDYKALFLFFFLGYKIWILSKLKGNRGSFRISCFVKIFSVMFRWCLDFVWFVFRGLCVREGYGRV